MSDIALRPTVRYGRSLSAAQWKASRTIGVDMKSRMSREAHVRFCERLRVRLALTTRPGRDG